MAALRRRSLRTARRLRSDREPMRIHKRPSPGLRPPSASSPFAPRERGEGARRADEGLWRCSLLAIALFLAGAAHAATSTTAPSTTNNDDTCDIGVMPAATLLLPYFE